MRVVSCPLSPSCALGAPPLQAVRCRKALTTTSSPGRMAFPSYLGVAEGDNWRPTRLITVNIFMNL